jgi:hypothetical protein
MKDVPRILLLALGSVLAFGPGLGATEEDEIHACPDGNGNVVFQTEPCRKIPEKEVPPSPPAPAPTKTPAPAPTKPPALPSVRRMRTSWQKVRPAQGALPAPRSKIGEQTFPTSLVDSDQPAGPSFVSPEQTWRTFLAAIEIGDRTGAVACLTPQALEKLGPDAESLPLEELRKMVSGFTRIENEGDLGPYWSIHGVGASQRPKWILFEETDAGEWKIAGI